MWCTKPASNQESDEVANIAPAQSPGICNISLLGVPSSDRTLGWMATVILEPDCDLTPISEATRWASRNMFSMN